MRRKDRVWNLLVRPLLRAMLNADPSEASAELAAGLLRETVGQGGQACRPLVARNGLSHAFVEPALRLCNMAARISGSARAWRASAYRARIRESV